MLEIDAIMLVYSQDGTEMQFPMANRDLQVGDLVFLSEGNYIPADTKILSGNISVDGQIFEPKSIAIGGLKIINGTAKGYVFAKAEDSQLALIEE